MPPPSTVNPLSELPLRLWSLMYIPDGIAQGSPVGSGWVSPGGMVRLMVVWVSYAIEPGVAHVGNIDFSVFEIELFLLVVLEILW